MKLRTNGQYNNKNTTQLRNNREHSKKNVTQQQQRTQQQGYNVKTKQQTIHNKNITDAEKTAQFCQIYMSWSRFVL